MRRMLALSPGEVLAFWGWTLALVVATCLVLATLVYLLTVVGPFRSGFGADMRHKFDRKRELRSGRRFPWRYPYVVGLLLLDAGTQATFWYRVSRLLLRAHLRFAAEAAQAFARFATHIDVSVLAEIGPGLSFFHGGGAVIGKGTRIGARVTLCQGVTTGGGRPVIGDDVVLWAGAKVIGDVTIGDRAEVGANAVVLSDVPADHLAVGVPATRLLPKAARAAPVQDD